MKFSSLILIVILFQIVGVVFSQSYSYSTPVSFAYWYRSGYETSYTSPEFVDLNGDGLIDMMIAFYDGADSPIRSYVYTYMNTGCSFVNQTDFSPKGYCNTTLQNPKFNHLRKMAMAGEPDPLLFNFLAKFLQPFQIELLKPIFATEMITLKTIRYLSPKDLQDLGLPVGLSHEIFEELKSQG